MQGPGGVGSPLDPFRDIRILNGDSLLRFAVVLCPGMGGTVGKVCGCRDEILSKGGRKTQFSYSWSLRQTMTFLRIKIKAQGVLAWSPSCQASPGGSVSSG